MAIHEGDRAVSRDVLEILGTNVRNPLRVGVLHHGFGKGMLRLPLDGSRHAKDAVLRHPVDENVGHLRLPPGERARLIHDNGLDASRGLQGDGVLEEDPSLRTEARSNHDRRRRGQAERVGARDHDDRDRVEHRRVE